jgi:hypothetical protein
MRHLALLIWLLLATATLVPARVCLPAIKRSNSNDVRASPIDFIHPEVKLSVVDALTGESE